MTETRLRSFTHLAGYAFASLFIASLARSEEHTSELQSLE